MQRFEYIIVGAGSAGCVLAGKLAASGRRVLLLEAGGSDRHPWIRMPLGYARTFFDPRFNWCFEGESDAGTNGRRAYWPCGKVIGGSSSINALCYVRAHPRDFADWQAAGNTQWSWNEAQRYYRRFEKRIDANGNASLPAGLAISNVSAQYHPLSSVFQQAAVELGQPVTADFNADDNPCLGIGPYHVTTEDGQRCSSADAFLRPFMGHANLSIERNAEVRLLLMSGRRVTGVEYVRKGRFERVSATREVILSAGALGSLHLLLRSVIGPGESLQANNVPVVVDSPQVGRNLQDHLAISYYFRSRVPTLNDELGNWRGLTLAVLRYLMVRRGPLALSVNQYGGFVQTDVGLPGPELQLYLNPIAYSTGGDGDQLRLSPESAFILSYSPTRPKSRGFIELDPRDWFAPPRIHPGYLSDESDLNAVVAGGRFLRRFAQTEAVREVTLQAESPALDDMSDADMIADFRARAGTVYHPIGTCAMNPDPTKGVVDQRLRVHGVGGLRVADAPVFPNLTTGNTNATTIMLAHKAADQVLAGT